MNQCNVLPQLIERVLKIALAILEKVTTYSTSISFVRMRRITGSLKWLKVRFYCRFYYIYCRYFVDAYGIRERVPTFHRCA